MKMAESLHNTVLVLRQMYYFLCLDRTIDIMDLKVSGKMDWESSEMCRDSIAVLPETDPLAISATDRCLNMSWIQYKRFIGNAVELYFR